MPNVFFYHNAENKLVAACQLLRKAAAQGKGVAVFAESAAMMEQVDRLLWEFDPISFVPHCTVDSPHAERTPVVLATSPAGLEEATKTRTRVLYLGVETPPQMQGVEALIEVVGQDDEDRVPARARFRAYKESGYAIQSIDLSQNRG